MSFSNDSLGSLILKQPQHGYRFSMDSVLLAYFTTLKVGPVLDLGAGCGIITRLLMHRGAKGPFTAVEIDPLAVECCQANVPTATILRHDIRQAHEKLPAQGFSLLVSNPPFALPGRGRISPNASKASARHQLSFTMQDLWQAANRLLKARGRLALCLPPRLLDMAFNGMQTCGLFAKRLRLVHGRLDLPAKIALLEAVKSGGPELQVEPPFIIYKDADNNFTEEAAAIYRAI